MSPPARACHDRDGGVGGRARGRVFSAALAAALAMPAAVSVADPVALFARLCLATMGDLAAIEAAAKSLGLDPDAVNDADPRHLTGLVESPWPEATLESIGAQMFTSGLDAMPLVTVNAGLVHAAKPDGRGIVLRECHVSVLKGADPPADIAAYLDAFAVAVAESAGEPVPLQDSPSSERGEVSLHWIDEADGSRGPVEHSVRYNYGRLGPNLSSMTSLESYRETP